jgi:hypothetical protein
LSPSTPRRGPSPRQQAKKRKAPPAEVAESRALIKSFFQQEDAQGQRIGRAKCGVYAFCDYDGEPIYVGKTVEGLSGRVSRHLTGRRSDAVGKFVLDPFEVLDVEVWPMFWLPKGQKPDAGMKAAVASAEYKVYQQALAGSRFDAVLNEGVIVPAADIQLPQSFRGRIVPDRILEDRKHPDIRIARRASTIANLTRLVSEREVKKGLRTTLLVQAQRLEHLSRERLADFADEPDEVEQEQ